MVFLSSNGKSNVAIAYRGQKLVFPHILTSPIPKVFHKSYQFLAF